MTTAAPHVLPQVAEALFRQAILEHVNDALRAAVKAAGYDIDARPFKSCPRDIWLRVLEVAAQHAFRGVPLGEALRQLGHATVDGYTRTLHGKLFVTAAPLLGPVRMLRQAENAFSAGDNFTKTKLTELGPASFVLWVGPSYPPQYIRGLVERSLKLSGAPNPQVAVDAAQVSGTVFRVTWTVK